MSCGRPGRSNSVQPCDRTRTDRRVHNYTSKEQVIGAGGLHTPKTVIHDETPQHQRPNRENHILAF